MPIGTYVKRIPSRGTSVIEPNGSLNPMWWQFFYTALAAQFTVADYPDLAAIEDVTGAGLLTRTALNTWVLRTVAGTSPIVVTNGDGVSSNPTISLASSGITPNTYGSSTQIPVYTVDTYGRLTATTNTAITYTYPTSGISQTLVTRLSTNLSVFDYGATGNGSTDDTTAIQNTLTQAAVLGKSVYFPPGTYKITSQLNITAGLHIFGAGQGVTVLAPYTNTQHTFYIDTAAAVLIEDLRISAGVTKTAGAGIYITSTTVNKGTVIKNCLFGDQWYGIYIARGAVFTIESCYIASAGSAEIYVSDTYNVDTGDSLIHGNVLDTSVVGTTYGILQVSGGGLKILGNKIINHTYGYALELAAGASTSDVIIANNSIEASSTAGISFRNPSGGTVFTNINIVGNQIGCTTPIEVRDNLYSLITIDGNIITPTGTSTNGVYLEYGDQTVISGNTFFHGGTTNIAINIAAGTDGTVIGANVYSGFTTNISDSGTNTNYGVLTSGAAVQGDLLYGSAANVYTRLAKNASATRYLSNTGASNNPAWAQIDVSNGITGLVPLTNGGTAASLTASTGGIVYSGASALAILSGTATASKLLLSGSSAAPTWSTSTISSSAGATANKALISDGTNYVVGTVSLTVGVTGVLPEANGGTNQSTYAQGDLLYASAANTLAKLAKDAGSTRVLTNTGASNAPAWAQVALTTGVSGVLPVANGGTGATSGVSVDCAANASMIASANTKIPYDTERFDIANEYDPTTNYRFTPQTAGYYWVYATIEFSSATINATEIIYIYVNGAAINYGLHITPGTSFDATIAAAALVHLNGSTDYVEAYFFHNSAVNTNLVGGAGTNFIAFRIPGTT